MLKKYKSLGLMSGTSGDGVDASLLISNGKDYYESIKDKYYEYDDKIYNSIHLLKEKINEKKDLIKLAKEISELERKITLFHAKIIKDFKNQTSECIIGFHGQTIYHNSNEKISYQLGDANLLFQLSQRKIISNFRKNDLLNGGEGAPLTPLFHQLIASQNKFNLPLCILNIGGISNVTIINESTGSKNFFSKDIGPGNCLIDQWVRKHSSKKYDLNGNLASSGEINEIILEQAQELHTNRVIKKKSLDVGDFDISFARGLSLKDGARTLTDFTASLIGDELTKSINLINNSIKNIYLCGGGRKNKILIENIKQYLPPSIKLRMIDDFKINGDFIESQAFAFLAIRSYLNLPITFPNTTGCKKPCSGGELTDS